MIKKKRVINVSLRLYKYFVALYIRRENILEDTLTEFESYEQNGALHNFRIEFVKEPGVDQGLFFFYNSMVIV